MLIFLHVYENDRNCTCDPVIRDRTASQYHPAMSWGAHRRGLLQRRVLTDTSRVVLQRCVCACTCVRVYKSRGANRKSICKRGARKPECTGHRRAPAFVLLFSVRVLALACVFACSHSRSSSLVVLSPRHVHMNTNIFKGNI